MLKNKTITFQFGILIVMNLIFITILSTSSYFFIKNILQDVYTLGKESIPSIYTIYEIKVNLLNHRRALLALSIPDIKDEKIQEAIDLINKGVENISKNIEEYDEIPRTQEEDQLYKKMIEIRKKHLEVLLKYRDLGKKLLIERDKDQKEEIRKQIEKNVIEIDGEYSKKFYDLYNSLDELVHYIKNYYGNTLVEQSLQDSKTYNFWGILISLLFILLGIVSNIFIMEFIVNNLKNSITTLTTASNQIQSASNQVSKSSQNLSTHASELASSIEEITSSMEELQSIIDSNTKAINEGKILMQETNENANQTKQISDELQKAMKVIIENSKKINKINKVIEDIAFQTNILALNASVEAARAGDAGRGFAVVAEQVKNLAQKSTESAKETNDLIVEILESVEKGNEQVQLTANSILKVSELSNKVMILLEEVTQAFKEQTKGAQQVTSAISQINQSVQQVASSSEENASMGEELQSQILQIVEIIERLQQMVEKKEKTEQKKENQNLVLREKSQESTITKKEEKKEIKIKSDKKTEIIKPEDKIPLEDLELKDFKDF